MKKLYCAFLMICFWQVVHGQGLYIPDANFKAKLLAAEANNEIAKNHQGQYIRIDSNGNGEIEVAEALAVSYLNVSSSAITDLTGIEYFEKIMTLLCNDNKLLTISTSALPLLTSLQCANNEIVSLNLTTCTKLYSLSCANNRLTNLILDNPSLNFMDCQHNDLVSLEVNNSPNLEYLYCSYNSLTHLDLLGNGRLRDLECSFNRLTVLDASKLIRLRDLECNNNQLTLLQLAGNFIKKLYCNNNRLTQLNLSAQTVLEELNCSNNALTALNIRGLSNLKRILMQNNRVASLTDLIGYPELVSLIADNNKLSALTISCPLISELSLSYNQLENLRIYECPELDARGFNFRNNPLTLLDVRGFERLTSLSCNNYGLTSALTVMADESLQSISFNNNRLQSLDITQCLGVETLSFDSNPILASLFIKNGKHNASLGQSLLTAPLLRYICADESEIDPIKSQLGVRSGTECEVNSYCSFTPGGRYAIIRSSTTFDSDKDGCSAEDIVVSYAGYKVIQGTKETIYFSDKSGQYDLPLLHGTATIIPLLANPTYFEVSPPSISYTISSQQQPLEQRFCLKTKGEHSDLEVTLLPLGDAVPGYVGNYAISYRNKGTGIQSGSIQLQFDAALLNPEPLSPAEGAQDPGRMSWSFSNLKPFESRTITIRFRLNTPADSPSLNEGDILNYKVEISSSLPDAVPEDNRAILRQKVVNSFDPNDKTCLQGLSVSSSIIGEYVHYIIRFENTGNFIANNIVVKDLIDLDRFDISSLSPIESSHSFTTKINDVNMVEFVFKDIDLPFYDHINDGYIAFKIKTKPSLAPGDSFSNGANIYFDFNLPIMTETVVTTIESLGGKDYEFSNHFTISPNPVKDILTIINKDELQMKSIAIYNMMGQPVMIFSNTTNSKALDISNLSSGNYVAKIYSDEGISTSKFVKY